MVGELSAAIERVRIRGEDADSNDLDGWINEDASKEREPRKKSLPTSAALKRDLEAEFLTPPTTFNAQWLNKLQQRWDAAVNYAELCELAPTQTRTIIRFTSAHYE